MENRNIDKILERHKKLKERSFNAYEGMNGVINEGYRVAEVAGNAKYHLDRFEDEFRSQTKLDGVDMTFLFFAIALQCVRQYALTKFEERLTDKEAAKKVKRGGTKESSDRLHGWYKPSLTEISTNPVPYDAMFGSPDFGLDLGGQQHRFKTLGHDPLLGWIFGPANIVTSTLTTWDFNSYHVKTGMIKNGAFRDKITNNADTSKVFSYSKDRLFNGGDDGKKAVGLALCKHWVHIKSDIYSKSGLPIPIISTISPDIAKELAKYGIDIGNVQTVGKQASMSILINTLIAMIHGMLYDETKYSSRSLYEVKTRMILSISNTIASSSNVIYVAVKSKLGHEDALRYLDVGGLMVTIYRIINDANFIREIKKEFVYGNFYNMIRGEF